MPTRVVKTPPAKATAAAGKVAPGASGAKTTPRRATSSATPRRRSGKAAELKPVAEPPINTFNRALVFLDTLANFEALRIVRYSAENFNLERMRGLCRKLGDPHLAFPTAHVAGSKGKGSTCAMAAAMLRAAGYRVGLYSSPHLVDIRERIRILEPDQDPAALPQGEMISQAQFTRLTESVEPFVTKARLRPTYFDTLTAIAFRHFADRQVDIALIETGLGGRLDSTNVVEPLVTAITPISLDHVRQLGGTLELIAAEKAGIFKPGTPAVTCQQPPEVEAVLRKVARDQGVQLRVLGTEIDFSTRFEASRDLGRHNRICFSTERIDFDHLAVPLFGEHQSINCGIALAIVDALAEAGFDKIDARACDRGLAGLRLEGRMEVLRDEKPMVMVDAAHNAASVEALFRGLGQHFSYDASVVIFGCCNDKDIDGMLEKLVAGADKIIFTRVNSVRSAEPRELAQRYTERFGKPAQVGETLEEALRIARRSITDDDLLCITGSFYLVGHAKKLYSKRAARSG